MSDTPNAWSSTARPGSNAASVKSGRSIPAETTPLLNRSNSHNSERLQPSNRSRTSSSSYRSENEERGNNKKKAWERRPSTLALLLLCIAAALIALLCFITPATVEEYAKDAVQFTPQQLAVDRLTSDGALVDVRGDISIDAKRVRKSFTRTVGQVATWIIGKVKSGHGNVEVVIPEFGDMVLGTAKVPPMVLDIRNGRTTAIAFKSEVEPGPVSGLKTVADDWIKGRLGSLNVEGKIAVPLTVGFISVGETRLSRMFKFKKGEIPAIPQYIITSLDIYEVDLPNSQRAMAVLVSLLVDNPYPVELTIPSLDFRILVDNCSQQEPFIHVADAVTKNVLIRPKRAAEVSVSGLVKQLPDALTAACPNSKDSPLDSFLGDYLHGRDTTIYVQGSNASEEATPGWISDILSNLTIAVPFPGHNYDNLIKQFTLSDVQLQLPDQAAPPNTPAAKPRVSGDVKVLISLPKEMNLELKVERIRANADIFYEGKKLGVLDVSKWRDATSSPVNNTDGGRNLLVRSRIDEAPVDITDQDVFADVVQSLIFGEGDLLLQIKADVDVQLITALGELTVKKIPAQGVIPVKPVSGGDGGLQSIKPSLKDLRIRGSSRHSLGIEAVVSFTNPTNYSAVVPFFDINVLTNGTLLGNATAKNVKVVPGRNEDLVVSATWDPQKLSGKEGLDVGRELLSQYVSGYNTSITLRSHRGTIPALPNLGELFKHHELNMTTPRLKVPGEPEDGDGGGDNDDNSERRSHFIKGAVMHLLTSTATFTLASPLPSTTIFITKLHATAYHHSSTNVFDAHYNDAHKPSTLLNFLSFFSSSSSLPSTVINNLKNDKSEKYHNVDKDEEEEGDNDDKDRDPSLGDPVGTIDHTLPFAVPPGISTTPRLPVAWNVGSVGHDAVRQALGNSLKLSARAKVTVRVGEWEEELWFVGHGIGAGVRL